MYGPAELAFAEDLGGDALADLALGVAVFQQHVVGMRVHVDEAGRDDSPLASISRLAVAGGTRPTATMRSPRMATSPRNHGLPVPSTILPLRMTRS